jgi:hypothetical protein
MERKIGFCFLTGDPADPPDQPSRPIEFPEF